MSELAALLCDETTSEAAVYPTKALVLDTLRREHEEGSTIDPRDRVFALLIEAWTVPPRVIRQVRWQVAWRRSTPRSC